MFGYKKGNSLAENRRARYDYNVLEKVEAGIELFGHEVKSAKSGRIQIAGSYAVFRSSSAPRLRQDFGGQGGVGGRGGVELFLINSEIPPYQPKNTPADYNPSRSRRLLLKKSELKSLLGKKQERGLTIVPLRAYVKRGLIKIELGLGKSRKKHDKREMIKKRDTEREIRRKL